MAERAAISSSIEDPVPSLHLAERGKWLSCMIQLVNAAVDQEQGQRVHAQNSSAVQMFIGISEICVVCNNNLDI